MIHPYPLFHLE